MDLNINVAEMEAKRKKELEEEEIERHLLSEQFDIAIYGLVINKFPGLSIRETGIVRWKFHDDVGEKVERMSPLLRKAKEYYNELLALSSADLFALEREQRESKGAQGNKPTVSDVVNRGWFFEQLDAQADLEHWSRAEYWTPDEAVAVSFGKNPNVVNANTLKSYLGKASFADEYYLRRDLVDRAIQSGRLPREIPPADFVAWLHQRSIPVPRGLADCLSAIEATSSQSSAKPLSDTERDSLLKLLLGMSIDKYDYKVGETRNPATGENRDSINAALERLDLKLTSDTIRKYLKEAEQRFGDHLKNPRKD